MPSRCLTADELLEILTTLAPDEATQLRTRLIDLTRDLAEAVAPRIGCRAETPTSRGIAWGGTHAELVIEADSPDRAIVDRLKLDPKGTWE